MSKDRKGLLKMTAVLFLGAFLLANTCFSLTIGDSVKLYDRGKREYRRGDYDDAIGYFKRSINECPESAITPVAMFFLAKSYKMEGNVKMAGSTFDQLIAKYRSGKWVEWAQREKKRL